jgi:D-alanyl-lipoteichoic acid acyltransferase DltB (MBOAT superfamily)
MLFNSLSFAVFFPVVTLVYFFLPARARWVWLLGASSWFYMAFVPAYILILFATIVIDYVAALQIERAQGKARRAWLVVSIVLTASLLVVFKYFNFLSGTLKALADALAWRWSLGTLELLLPVGLSFHTFQSLSYVIEVYRGNQKPERHFGIYALYVMFYPQLVAGPIERPQSLLPQFKRAHAFDSERVARGLTLMAFGFFKKIVVADRLAEYVNAVYADVGGASTIPVLLAVFFFSIQIYCDFSGYTDIARGSARVMGFELMRNFDRPYLARSLGEFWRRWHISLSSWLRDYVYVPLGGDRLSAARTSLNLLLTFLFSGLWHGANVTFVVWGALHGGMLVLARVTRRTRAGLGRALGLERWPRAVTAVQVLLTFSFVSLAWVFFRASSLDQAVQVFGRIAALDLRTDPLALSAGRSPFKLALCFVAIGLFFAAYRLPRQLPVRTCAALAAVVTLLVVGTGGAESEFIYFQF